MHPSRPGVYQRRITVRDGLPLIQYAYWSGTRWYKGSVSNLGAWSLYRVSIFQTASECLQPWRGLSEESTSNEVLVA